MAKNEQVTDQGLAIDQSAQYLTFTIQDELFGLSINFIKEVVEFSQITAIPLMPEVIKGVLNLRGEVVPVIDLAMRFDKPPVEIKKRTSIIIMEVPYEDELVTVGAIVNSVSDVIEIQEDAIEPPTPFGASIKAELIKGVYMLNGEFVILLRAEKALSITEMANLVESLQARAIAS